MPEHVKDATAAYFEELYTPHPMELFDSEWTAHVEQCIKRWQEDLSHDALHINKPMTTTEIGEVTKKLKSGKIASPENISVTEYAKMVDNMFETIVNSNMGAKYGHITISALLLMDDITLIADTPTELQSMLSIIQVPC